MFMLCVLREELVRAACKITPVSHNQIVQIRATKQSSNKDNTDLVQGPNAKATKGGQRNGKSQVS